MKPSHRRISTRVVILALLIALAGQTPIILAADINAPASTPVNPSTDAPAIAPAPTPSSGENWVNVSAVFTKEQGLDDIKTPYCRRCVGLIVSPTGDLFMLTANQGVCISKDQGATWTVGAGDSKVSGRCENGFGSSIAYPYDGRLAFFAFDGSAGMAGGMSLDGGQTWKLFTENHRGPQFGDIDWSAQDPQTVFALTHEPFFTTLSNDAGKTWQQLYSTETGSRDALSYKLGVIDGKTLVRADNPKGVIELSTDAGQTWTQVAANFKVEGFHPVHYGKNLYWTTTQGVITSPNGKDWTLTGPGAEGAFYGPFFGSSEQEFVVVTQKLFLKTEDGGKTWKSIANFYKAPDIFKNQAQFAYFGWDSKHNILYASGVAASVYQLKL